MDEQNRNLILATAASLAILLAWFTLGPALFPDAFPETQDPQPEDVESLPAGDLIPPGASASGQDGIAPLADPPGSAASGQASAPNAASLPEAGSGTVSDAADAPRIEIDTPRLKGSISLQGGRLDDLQLKDYRNSIDPDSEIVTVLLPETGADLVPETPHYVLHGWSGAAGLARGETPGDDTPWIQRGSGALTVETPVTLAWTSPGGLEFARRIEIDEDFMFTVTQSVTNGSGAEVAMAPYGAIARHGEPPYLKNFFILHEGLVRMADGELDETDYSDFPDLPPARAAGQRLETVVVEESGWIGFTDHYWMSALVPAPGSRFRANYRYVESGDVYRAEIVQQTLSVPPGGSVSTTSRVFAGAKEWEAISRYQDSGVENFVESIDWGWFHFLTKPIFWLLHEINLRIGNMGWSIIVLTLILKAVLFPLAFKSYVSMAKMKELQPEMEKLKKAAGDDRSKLQKGMMELYRKEKVNPAAGCLPILLQIPIFFSLYKVIFVTIELRHAEWFGVFRDLSAPDPTSIVNFFGWLPWSGPTPGTIPALILIGILPLLLGISMWLQQKLNPAPTDPTQAMVFAWMPWAFMFMLGSFASGLVVYWITNNVITFAQQYLIMRSQGYKPDVFGNILSGFKRGAKVADKKTGKG